MKPFTHVRVGVTDALFESDLRQVDPASWQVLNYSETGGLGGTPVFTFSLPGRATLRDGTRRPWREVLSAGDLVQASGWSWDGETSAEPVTMTDGLITSMSTHRTLTPTGYEYTTQVNCVGLGSVLEQDSVAWWMYYGSAEGWARARAELLPDDLSGKPDKIMANYMNKVVFHHASWQRAGKGLEARMGYHFAALPASAPLNTNLAVAEGTHLGILSELLDPPLHELYTAVLPASAAPQGGFAHRPTLGPERAIIGEVATDGGRTWLMMRKAPYPSADKSGQPVMHEWRSLPLYDYSDAEGVELYDGQGHDHTDQNVRNFFLVQPAFQFLDDRMAFTAGIAVKNEASIRRYAYRPLKIRTHLVLETGDRLNPIELAKALTCRLAAQHNRLDEYMDGSIQLPLDPAMRPGVRVRYRDPDGDQTDPALMEAHVVGYTREWSPERGGNMVLQLNRILSAANYSNPQWFVTGLSPVQVDTSQTAPSTAPK